MTVDLLALLDGVKQTGPSQWEAKCSGPDHDDRHASLSVSIGDDGRWLVHCFAGCTLEAIVAGLGLDVRDLFARNGDRPWGLGPLGGETTADFLPDPAHVERWASDLQRNDSALAAIHDAKGWRPGVLAALGVGLKGDRYSIPVRSLEGELVQLLTYRPNGSPKMLALRGHARKPLYCLVDDHGPVFVDEGETDAIALAHVGVNAIGLPGASARVRPEWLEPLRGRIAYVCGDNDDPGRAWARRCATVAHELASETRVVELEGAKGYDVGDFVREHRDDPDRGRAAWLELVEQAPPWSPPSQRADQGWDQGAGPPLGDADDAPADSSVDRIVRALFVDAVSTRDGGGVREAVPGTGGLLWRGTAHTLFGERGEGKTIAALIVTLAAAACGERVLYLDRENGDYHVRGLVEGVLDAHEDWPDVLEDEQWVGRHYPALSREWEPAALAAAITGRGFTGVVYDSVREALSELGGDSNAEADYSTLMRVLVTPLVSRGLSVALLDNVGHVEKGRPKGTGAKLDAVPIAYQVRTVSEFGPVTEGTVELKCTARASATRDASGRSSWAVVASTFPRRETSRPSSGRRARRTSALRRSLAVSSTRSRTGRSGAMSSSSASRAHALSSCASGSRDSSRTPRAAWSTTRRSATS
jgi:hypothetical protein